MKICRVHVMHADGDEECEHDELDDDDSGVDARGFADAEDEQSGQREADENCRKIDERGDMGSVWQADVRSGRSCEPWWKLDSHFAEQGDEVTRPPDGNRRGAEGVLEYEVPTDNPGDQLAQSCVSVGVGAAGYGNHARQLGVAESRKNAGDAGQHYRERERGSGVLGGDLTADDEDSCSNHGTDAEGDEGKR